MEGHGDSIQVDMIERKRKKVHGSCHRRLECMTAYVHCTEIALAQFRTAEREAGVGSFNGNFKSIFFSFSRRFHASHE